QDHLEWKRGLAVLGELEELGVFQVDRLPYVSECHSGPLTHAAQETAGPRQILALLGITRQQAADTERRVDCSPGEADYLTRQRADRAREAGGGIHHRLGGACRFRLPRRGARALRRGRSTLFGHVIPPLTVVWARSPRDR